MSIIECPNCGKRFTGYAIGQHTRLCMSIPTGKHQCPRCTIITANLNDDGTPGVCDWCLLPQSWRELMEVEAI